MRDTRWTDVSGQYLAPRHSGGDAWTAEAAAAGHRGTQQILSATRVAAAPNVAHALGLRAGDLIIARRRLVLLDERPVEIADSYYPAALADGTLLSKPGKIPGGAVTLLADLGFVAANVDEYVSARQPTDGERELLQLTDDDPVLVLARISATDMGSPFEYAVMVMTSAGRQLHYQTRSKR